MVNCLICKNKTNVSLIDEYKFNILEDRKYFGIPKIYFCQKCDFSFCNPMPNERDLDMFYTNVYRQTGRPHEIIISDLESELYSNKNLSYLQYLTTFIDFSKINNIFDFGCGTGDLGHLLKKKFNHLNLFCSEKDNNTKGILEDRGYVNFENLRDISQEFDLIMSIHSLEHLTNLNIFNFFKTISHSETFFFFEVPNNIFKDAFLKRPYDSPHLLFFSENSLKQISTNYQFQIINLSHSSIDIYQAYEIFKKNKQKFENWKHEKKNNFNINSFKIFLKKYLPKQLQNFLKKFKLKKNSSEILDDFTLNKKNSWCIRGLFKLN